MALQAAFGTWPSDTSFSPDHEFRDTNRSALNESFTFGEEADGRSYDAGAIVNQGLQRISSASNTGHDLQTSNKSNPVISSRSGTGSAKDQDDTSTLETGERQEHTRSGTADRSLHHEDEPIAYEMEVDLPSRSPSPATPDEDFDRELRSLWSTESHEAFHDMVTADGYINRYRMHIKKRQRLAHYLEHPDLDPVLCDGTKDHQTKYQAANWTLIDGKLYRKPDVGRVGKPRRHLDEFEAWEVLTREHLRSGHLGRDKLRKRLERRYIGYTLQEIMLVLKECRRCGGRDRVVPSSVDPPMRVLPRLSSVLQQHTDPRVPYLRGQTSNAMLP